MKKVMHLISTSVFSGAENVACQIISGFKNNPEYEMVYTAVIGTNKSCLEDRQVKIIPLKKFNFNNIRTLIRDYNPDIIHAHDSKSAVISALFYKKARIIAHIHGNHENMRRLTVKSFLFNLFSKRFTNIIWVSKSSLEEYKFKDKVLTKSIVLYNTIDSKEIYLKAKDDEKKYNFDLIFLGRMSYPKNPQRLIKIISEVVKEKPQVKVALVGSGELDDQVKELITLNKLEKNIEFYGFLPNPYKILISSKIMIMTSRYEGTPMCALEAISCGLPIISTKTDGLKEIVINNETGFLSDDDNEIVERIIYLLEDEMTYEQMKKNVLKFNKDINNFENYINEITYIYSGR